MPTAKLTFKLPEEREEFEDTRRAGDYKDALVTIREAFRSHRKYDGPVVTEEVFFQILTDHDIGGLI